MTPSPPPSRPPNALARESSLYLRQHAHNPVPWRPWGPDALAEARRRDVPIFLSIGYSTCHWCHVMERESFEDPEVARLLDADFVCIKVDREERPDLDDVFMAATQIMTGHGGWPMSVFLEPERLLPFWCGTYFPPEPRHNLPSFGQVIAGMASAWRTERAGVLEQARALADAVREHLAHAGEPRAIGIGEASRAASDVLRMFDRVHAGFGGPGGGPKFPQTPFLEFLLDARAGAGEGSGEAIDECLRRTLDAMMLGGLRDHVGGGFHRYAVDPAWSVPHFEKMLTDNVALGALYARASLALSDAEYARVARETLGFVLGSMRTPEGLLAGAIDADADGREGISYVWTDREIADALQGGSGESGDDEGFARAAFDLDSPSTIFVDPHHPPGPDEPVARVLRLRARPEELARRAGLSLDDWHARLASVRARLLARRALRPQPHLDPKAVLAWNASGAAALLRAGLWLDWPHAIEAGSALLSRVLDSFAGSDAGFFRVRDQGRAHTPAMLDDLASLADALAAARRANIEPPAGRAWDTLTRGVLDACDRGFGAGSAHHGAYFDSTLSDLFVRPRTTHDAAAPCGNSILAHALLDLAIATGDASFAVRGERLLAALSSAIADAPASAINSTRALLRLLRIDAAAGGQAASRLAEQGERRARRANADAETDFTPVEVYASADRVSIGMDQPAELSLVVSIAPGYHVAAARPGPGGGPLAGLVAMRVLVTGGGGVRAYADYPEGVAGPDGSLVHRGSFEMRVALERDGAWSGRPMLALAFQACADGSAGPPACYPARVVELSVALDPA